VGNTGHRIQRVTVPHHSHVVHGAHVFVRWWLIASVYFTLTRGIHTSIIPYWWALRTPPVSQNQGDYHERLSPTNSHATVTS